MIKKYEYTVEEVYSVLCQLLNELEDDLGLDLENGETGYKTYEESYNAVKKYTLKKLKKMVKNTEKKMRLIKEPEEQRSNK